MKIKTYGARFFGGQVDRIDDGFRALGHEIVQNAMEADLLYDNNPWWRDIIKDKQNPDFKGKAIFNILDLAPHLGEKFEMHWIKEGIIHADAVTCISETVAKDIKNRVGIDASVIYNPVKPIFRKTPEKNYHFRALFVGRVCDAEKRTDIGAEALNICAFDKSDIITVGGESPRYGGYYGGAVNDQILNELYNTVDYLICPTRNAFLGLPILEAMAVGCIPVICNDLDILEEFIPTDKFPEYKEVDPNPWSIATFISKLQANKEYKAEFKERVYNHYNSFIKSKVEPIEVAKRIINVYNNIK